MNPMMQQNPIAMLVNMQNAGKNPMAVLEQMAGQSPQVGQFLKMVRGKSPDQLRTIAENMAKERGTTVDMIAQQLGMRMK